jgi:hypothetical protein
MAGLPLTCMYSPLDSLFRLGHYHGAYSKVSAHRCMIMRKDRMFVEEMRDMPNNNPVLSPIRISWACGKCRLRHNKLVIRKSAFLIGPKVVGLASDSSTHASHLESISLWLDQAFYTQLVNAVRYGCLYILTEMPEMVDQNFNSFRTTQSDQHSSTLRRNVLDHREDG